jgi:hypothetical protein
VDDGAKSGCARARSLSQIAANDRGGKFQVGRTKKQKVRTRILWWRIHLLNDGYGLNFHTGTSRAFDGEEDKRGASYSLIEDQHRGASRVISFGGSPVTTSAPQVLVGHAFIKQTHRTEARDVACVC